MAKFQPGQSGNPGGRPQSHLNKLLSRYLRAKDGDKTREQKLVEKICELALAGDMRAAVLIWDRMEGKVREEVDLSLQEVENTTENDLSLVPLDVLKKIRDLYAPYVKND